VTSTCRHVNGDPSLLDIPILEELRALDAGGPRFLRDLVHEFLESCENELSAIAEFLVANDLERVWQLAHGLKGACLMVGAKQLGEAIQELERAARVDDRMTAARQLPEIRSLHGATRDAFLSLL